jgi:hypothetical protein
MDDLIWGVALLRRELEPLAWRDFTSKCREHPLHAILLQSPYTLRAFRKPRGYPGDAVILDLAYGFAGDVAPTGLGAQLYAYELTTQGHKSVTFRREHLAHVIVQESRRAKRPNILSLACGHVRELCDARAAEPTLAVSFFGLDQDAESLDYAGILSPDIVPLKASLGDLLKRRVAVPRLQFVYAAGLFDYLSDAQAAATLERMWDLLEVGGRALVANFVPIWVEAGYLEAFMDWWLIYRDESDLLRLAGNIVGAATRVYRDPHGNVAYLELERQ